MTESTIPIQSWMTLSETQKVMAALGDARFVGGCVRNALANRPVVDIDIATPLTPHEVIDKLTEHKIGYAPTGLKHGTVTAIVDGHPFEITTLRVDVATDGRHAKVDFTTDWQEDAARRDFTMNAMSCTPEGKVFDFFCGIEDLRLGRVRFVGDAAQRIEEDVLRILRFFRFYAHFGKGEPDAQAIAACRAAADKIPALSAERIRQEILKLLEADNCAPVWQLMIEAGIVKRFLPEADNVAALEKLVRIEGACHTKAFPLRRLAALLPGAGNVAERLRLSHDQGQQLKEMFAAPALKDDAAVRKSVYEHGNDMTRNLLLLAAARTGDEKSLTHLYEVATAFRAPRFPLTGDDALALGHKGPAVGQVLRQVEDWWTSKDFAPGRTECLEKLKNL